MCEECKELKENVAMADGKAREEEAALAAALDLADFARDERDEACEVWARAMLELKAHQGLCDERTTDWEDHLAAEAIGQISLLPGARP